MHRTITGGILILALLLFGLPLPGRTGPTPPAVVINELMWMGTSASSADEWVELRNLTDASVDLSGWMLTRKSSGSEVVMLSIPSGKSITAGGYFLIANNAPTAMFGTAPNQHESPQAVTPDLVDASVSLLNTGLQLKLYAGAWDAGVPPVDTADDGSGNPLAGAHDSSKGVYRSMERNLTPGDGTLVSSWHTANVATGWDAGARELGTPKTANSATDPIAVLAAPTVATTNEPATFDASESSDPEGRSLTFAWAFGDGATADGAAVPHTFATAGTFSVLVTVSNGERTASASASTSVVEPTVAAAPTPPSPVADLRLSELQASPSGAEFIEVVNAGTATANVGGWVVTDGVRRYTVPAGTTVGAGAVRSFPGSATGIHLNDDGDTVSLLDPTGRLAGGIRYAKARSGWSLAVVDGAWAWTDQPTPGAANRSRADTPAGVVVEAPALPETTTEPTPPVAGAATEKKSAKKPTAIATVSLADISELTRGTTVRVRGTVSAVPGSVAARTFYSMDGAGGVAVYAAKVPFPTLALGDLVEVTGRVSHVQRGDRLLVSRTADVRVLGHGPVPEPLAISASELDADARGSLVRVSGTVTDVASATLTLDDGSGEVSIRRQRGTKIKAGDAATITGIAVGNGETVRLLPRAASDIGAGTTGTTPSTSDPGSGIVAAAHAASPGGALTVDTPKPDRTGSTLLIVGIAVLVGALGVGLLKRYAPHWFEQQGPKRAKPR